MSDAEERFLEAVRTFQKAEEAARADISNVDEKAFDRAIIDLDAAMPGLGGLQLGRAKVLKGQALWWIYFHRLAGTKGFDFTQDYHSQLTEAHRLAAEGLAIMERNGASDRELSWARDVATKTGTG